MSPKGRFILKLLKNAFKKYFYDTRLLYMGLKKKERNDYSARENSSRHTTRKPTAGFVNVQFGMVIPSG